MSQVLLHIKDVELVLSRLYEVLREGGQLLIVDFDKNEEIESVMVHNGYDQLELIDHMTKIGYRNIQSKTFYNGKKYLWDMMHLYLSLIQRNSLFH